MDGALTGIKVVEVAMWAAGPGGGAILADWGADVIKIEDPDGGDPFRGFLTTGVGATNGLTINAPFEIDNRNKKSVAVNIRTEEGQKIIHRLIQDADVFLTNLRPGALERYHLDYETLRAHNTKMIYVGVTGYGKAGSERDRAAFDYAGFWARSGIMATMGEPDTPPPSQRPGMGDHTTTLSVAAATAAALFARERTGVGQEVGLSLYRTAVWVNSIDIQTALLTRQDIPRMSRMAVGNPLFNCYKAKDGKWLYLVMLQSDRHWPTFCETIRRKDFIHDPRFADTALRNQNAAELIAILDPIFAEKTRDEWAARLDAAGLFWGPVQTVEDVINDPQTQANGAFVPVDHPSGQQIEMVTSPVDFSETPATIRHAAPELGQNTEEVLLASGYSSEEMAKLREDGTIPL